VQLNYSQLSSVELLSISEEMRSCERRLSVKTLIAFDISLFFGLIMENERINRFPLMRIAVNSLAFNSLHTIQFETSAIPRPAITACFTA